jgi:hypothetical protein
MVSLFIFVEKRWKHGRARINCPYRCGYTSLSIGYE